MVACSRLEHALSLTLGRQDDAHKTAESLRKICEQQALMAQVQGLTRVRRQAWMQSQNAGEVVRKAGEALDMGFVGLQKATGQYFDAHCGERDEPGHTASTSPTFGPESPRGQVEVATHGAREAKEDEEEAEKEEEEERRGGGGAAWQR